MFSQRETLLLMNLTRGVTNTMSEVTLFQRACMNSGPETHFCKVEFSTFKFTFAFAMFFLMLSSVLSH